MKKNLILADAAVLPEVFSKVLLVKKLMKSGEADTVFEAVKMTGISRSAYYKYKDHVFPFNEMQGILTLFFELMDIPGTLSEILHVLANAGCNILTINQNIPVNGIAGITITIQTENMNTDINSVMEQFGTLSGVRTMDIIARQ